MKLLCRCTIIVGMENKKHNSIPALQCIKIFLNGFEKVTKEVCNSVGHTGTKKLYLSFQTGQ